MSATQERFELSGGRDGTHCQHRLVQRGGMGGHHSASALKDEWLTPPEILQALGNFDLDPCSPVNRPWATARKHYTIKDDGLAQTWEGRVWCNPPYGQQTGVWLERLADHGSGTALIFARTETEAWFRHVWPGRYGGAVHSGSVTLPPRFGSAGGCKCRSAFGSGSLRFQRCRGAAKVGDPRPVSFAERGG